MPASASVRPIYVIWKGAFLLVIANLLFAAWAPAVLGKVSAYNLIFPGRERFPFGENPAQAYNLSLFDMDAIFASHILAAAPKPADEFRIVIIGDSSIW